MINIKSNWLPFVVSTISDEHRNDCNWESARCFIYPRASKQGMDGLICSLVIVIDTMISKSHLISNHVKDFHVVLENKEKLNYNYDQYSRVVINVGRNKKEMHWMGETISERWFSSSNNSLLIGRVFSFSRYLSLSLCVSLPLSFSVSLGISRLLE